MGLLRWLRGGDDNDSSVAAMSAGMAELEGFVAPARRKQTELIQEMEQLREDTGEGSLLDRIDFESGVAVINRRTRTVTLVDDSELDASDDDDDDPEDAVLTVDASDEAEDDDTEDADAPAIEDSGAEEVDVAVDGRGDELDGDRREK